MPEAKQARRVPEEIGKAFEREDIKAALCYSFKRSERDVREYLEENFSLAPTDSLNEVDEDHDGRFNGEQNHAFGELDGSGIHETDETDSEDVQDIETAKAEKEQESIGESKANPQLVNQPRKPAKPDIMKRYAWSQGFRMDSGHRFVHRDGSWIARANKTRFPWERRAPNGDLVRYYWPMDLCLEREPLQLEADVWGLLGEIDSNSYALVLVDLEGDPIEITGVHLRAMCEEGKVTLYPATYRLVYSHDRQW